MRFGLVANRLHRQSVDGALLRWAKAYEDSIRSLNLKLHAVGGTYDALAREGVLSNSGSLVRLPSVVLNRTCSKVIFFEDPHVARHHEADIQVLERAVSTATQDTTCFNSPAMAARWAAAVQLSSSR